ncbi:MAG: hypothetical protein ISN29_00195 [Gammaproteobacteria bacterium AqS3]|nr:hypothetical protein [Gammaproteobacteria bacterium AqS3]
MDTPPEERLTAPDFRALHNRQLRHPGPDLLEMIYICRERQGRYRDDGVSESCDLETRSKCRTWEAALKQFITAAEDAGILVMCSGIVLSVEQAICMRPG